MSQNKEEKGTKQSEDVLTPNLLGLNQLRCVCSFDSVCLDWCKRCQWNSGADQQQQQPDKDSLKKGDLLPGELWCGSIVVRKQSRQITSWL